MSVYKVVSSVWHSKENRFCEVGEEINLSHLNGFELARVLGAGVVVAVPTVRKKKKSAPAKEGEPWLEQP